MTIDPYCRGCFYRSANKSFQCCDYMFLTGRPRGCPAGNGCIRKTSGKKLRSDFSIRPRMTDEEKKQKHRERERNRRAKKKAASSATNTENGYDETFTTK